MQDPHPQSTPTLDRLAQLAQQQQADAEAAAAAAATSDDLMRLAEELALLTDRIEEEDSALKELKKRREELRKQLIPDVMRALGMVNGNRGSFTFTLGKIHLETRTFTSIEDKEKAFEWLRSNGHEELITETVSGSAMGALVRELQEDGGALPPGVHVYEETAVKLSRPRS